MALAIVILLIGVPVGVWMFRNPDRLWWATESWKYKDPEANEPSEAAYGMSSLSGVLVIVASVVAALLVWNGPGDGDEDRPSASHTTTSTTRTKPARTALTSRPEDRGALPIVGHRVTPEGDRSYLDVSFLVPAGSAPVAGGFNFFTEQGCEVMRQVRGINTDRITVDLRLGWTRGLKATLADEGTCRLTGAWSPEVATIRIGEIRPDAAVVTDSDIVGPDAAVLTPAAPGNRVPRLAGAP